MIGSDGRGEARRGVPARDGTEYAVLYTGEGGERLVTQPTASRPAAERERDATRQAQALLGLAVDAELAVSTATGTGARSPWAVLR